MKNEQFKNDIAVTGSKNLVLAFASEMKILGYEFADSDLSSDYDNGYTHIRTKAAFDCISLMTKYAPIAFILPQEWDEALRLASEKMDELIKPKLQDDDVAIIDKIIELLEKLKR